MLLVATFLEPICEPDGGGQREAPPLWATLLATFRVLRDKRLCLLVLLPLYSGFQQAFLAGDYTKVRRLVCAPGGLRLPQPPQGSPCLRHSSGAGGGGAGFWAGQEPPPSSHTDSSPARLPLLCVPLPSGPISGVFCSSRRHRWPG